MFIIFGIVMAIGASGMKKKKKEEEKEEFDIKDIGKLFFTTKEGEKMEIKSEEQLEWIPEQYRGMAKKFFEGIKKEIEKSKKE
jgi:hypothetical protein